MEEALATSALGDVGGLPLRLDPDSKTNNGPDVKNRSAVRRLGVQMDDDQRPDPSILLHPMDAEGGGDFLLDLFQNIPLSE